MNTSGLACSVCLSTKDEPHLKFCPRYVCHAYVRATYNPKIYAFCEVGNDRRFDIRQGSVKASMIPVDIRDKCQSILGQAFSYVEVPKDFFRKVK